MDSSDILKPKSWEEINGNLSLWYHLNSTTPTFSMFLFLRAGLLWLSLFLFIGSLYIGGFVVVLVRFDYSDFGYDIGEIVQDWGEESLIDRNLTTLLLKHGYVIRNRC